MMKRMPGYMGENYPIWLWRRRVSRYEKALFPTGTRGVILTLEIPNDIILWSDFESWHFVLSNTPITDSEEEWEEYLRNEQTYPVVETREKIFDFEYLRHGIKNGMENLMRNGFKV